MKKFTMRRWQWMRINSQWRLYAVRKGRFGDEFVKIFGYCIWIPSFTIAIIFSLVLAGAALAANWWYTPDLSTVQGHVQLCLNTSGQAVPCSSAAGGSGGLPSGATPITAVFSGADTATAAATLAAGGAGKFTYICGFTVTGLGATAATPVSPTVATLASGNTLTFSYLFVAGATLQNTPDTFTFAPCLPASAANATIVVTVPGAAGNTATQINAWGFQL